jgi:hypothetical protein
MLTFGPSVVPGQNWLPDTIHGDGSPNLTMNGDGSVTIAGGGDVWNGQLDTALPTYPGYTGSVFGGGFYTEAVINVGNVPLNVANG